MRFNLQGINKRQRRSIRGMAISVCENERSWCSNETGTKKDLARQSIKVI